MSLKHRKLGRTSDQRRAMLRAMVTYLLENGQIKTTITRAKEVAPLAEKMITLAKQNDLAAYRQALGFITKEDVAKKLFQELGPKYAGRNGGYTRVVRIGPRRGDAAEMAIIQLGVTARFPKVSPRLLSEQAGSFLLGQGEGGGAGRAKKEEKGNFLLTVNLVHTLYWGQRREDHDH